MTKHLLRIHGDNILECENTLKLIVNSLNGKSVELIDGPAFAPKYKFISENDEDFTVQFFAGYGRWNFPLTEHIASLGGSLREAPDAIVTKLETIEGNQYETPVLAVEFSGALPAGNNAWQRTGRALALAYAGIPYLYFAELGGQELDANRKIKAARFPNPLVPFAYAVLGASKGSLSLPVYIPSPSSDEKIVEVFKDCFGTKDSVEIVRGILLSSDYKAAQTRIETKVLKILEILTNQRKRSDVLSATEWTELFSQKSGAEKLNWLIKKAMPWNKKTGIKTLTPTFKNLLLTTIKNGATAIGSREMPICIIPSEKRTLFGKEITKIYDKKAGLEFVQWVSNPEKPLICVWVAGFKPRGDDSRPDRGLVPLARMIFGIEDVDLLTVVYGPAKESTWELLEKDMRKLASINGLWEAIVNLSNGILVDSNTGGSLKNYGFLVNADDKIFEKKPLPAAKEMPNFGEHDVDAVLHLLFSNALENGVYESLCNPPGGDWSGISIYEPSKKLELRWTSLPRVSGLKSKRPDHIIQFVEDKILLSMESKDTSSTLEKSIGPRLLKYVDALLDKKPIAFREHTKNDWLRSVDDYTNTLTGLSGVAFRYQSEKDLKTTLKASKSDIALGVEFNTENKVTLIHIATKETALVLIPVLQKLANRLRGIISLVIHQ